jgi:hypothetical protein
MNLIQIAKSILAQQMYSECIGRTSPKLVARGGRSRNRKAMDLPTSERAEGTDRVVTRRPIGQKRTDAMQKETRGSRFLMSDYLKVVRLLFDTSNEDSKCRAEQPIVTGSERELRLNVYSRQCGLPYTSYGQHERSRSHVDPMLARDLPYRVIGFAHLRIRLLVDCKKRHSIDKLSRLCV